MDHPKIISANFENLNRINKKACWTIHYYSGEVLRSCWLIKTVLVILDTFQITNQPSLRINLNLFSSIEKISMWFFKIKISLICIIGWTKHIMGKLQYMHHRADVHYDFKQDSNAQWKKSLFLEMVTMECGIWQVHKWKEPPKYHINQVWFNLVQWYHRNKC